MDQRTNLSFISDFFEAFYDEVLRQKARVLSGQWRKSQVTQLPTPALQEEDRLQPPSTQPFALDVERILSVFQHLLDSQSITASQAGGAFGVACYREAQYIMVSLADEVFLNLPWEGRNYWDSHLLEERLFASHVSGERFFNLLDDFLKERNPLKGEIGHLYLRALGLGFRGKYRGMDDEGALELYRKQLFTFLYRQSPSLFQTDQPLVPQALAYTKEGTSIPWNEDLRRWRLGFLGIFLGYLFFAYAIWFGATSTLNHLVDATLSDLKQLR